MERIVLRLINNLLDFVLSLEASQQRILNKEKIMESITTRSNTALRRQWRIPKSLASSTVLRIYRNLVNLGFAREVKELIPWDHKVDFQLTYMLTYLDSGSNSTYERYSYEFYYF